MSDRKLPGTGNQQSETLALSTILEEDFISPLTEMRGALEILRDFPELDQASRVKFVDRALEGCIHLQHSVERLGKSIYGAGERSASPDTPVVQGDEFSDRIRTDADTLILEMDLSDFAFDSSDKVNAFFDIVDETVISSGTKWFFLVNFRNCSIWPEAWVAYAQRTKKIRLNFTFGTVRYAELQEGDAPVDDPAILPTRAAALDRIECMRAGS